MRWRTAVCITYETLRLQELRALFNPSGTLRVTTKVETTIRNRRGPAPEREKGLSEVVAR